MKTKITELLDIQYPIFQGGMAWVADGDLAGAVSNAGGLGIIGGGNAPKEVVKANIDKVKSITDRPFGVNIMLLSPFADDIVDLVIEEGVKVVTTGAGNPGKYMERLHAAGITVNAVVNLLGCQRAEALFNRIAGLQHNNLQLRILQHKLIGGKNCGRTATDNGNNEQRGYYV